MIVPERPDHLSEAKRIIEQFAKDLNQAHDEIVRLQDKSADVSKFDWPEWTPQANTMRWAEQFLGKRLAKTNNWTIFPNTEKNS